jgi:hypothetical protein
MRTLDASISENREFTEIGILRPKLMILTETTVHDGSG